MTDGRFGAQSRQGQCVGEVAFLADEATHSHSCVCLRDAEVVRLSKEAFRLAYERFPTLLHRISQARAVRLARGRCADCAYVALR